MFSLLTTRRKALTRPRTLIAGTIVGAGVLLSTLFGASAADAAVPGQLNPHLESAFVVPGTDCVVRTSMWLNDYRLPGAGAYTSCDSNHVVHIAVETEWASVYGGSWYRWGKTSPTYAGSGSTSDVMYQTWTVLGGQRQWRGVAYVWVDGVYRGWFTSRSGVWTAGS